MVLRPRIEIVLVEDNEDHAFLTETAIVDAQPEIKERLVVTTFTDGTKALSYLRGVGDHVGRPFPGLVLLDLKMDGMDGLEVLRAIRKDPSLNFVPVIVLTTSKREEDVREAYALGANEYVAKPTSPEEFRYKVQAIPSHWSRVVERPAEPNYAIERESNAR